MLTIKMLEQAGYQRFQDQFKKNSQLHQDPYKGTWQKCIRDHHGKKYFINIEMWDFADSDLRDRHTSKTPSFPAHAQFEGPDGTFNIELFYVQNHTLQAIENWFEKQWKMNECFYYEKLE